jgi:hypothetical protein
MLIVIKEINWFLDVSIDAINSPMRKEHATEQFEIQHHFLYFIASWPVDDMCIVATSLMTLLAMDLLIANASLHVIRVASCANLTP